MTTLLTVKEAASRLRISNSLCYQLCKEGRLTCYRPGGKGKRGKRLIKDETVEAYLESTKEELADD